jgi:DNA topoisomerase-1
MVVRNGRFGTFYACKNYPSCRFTKQKFTDIGISCPKCGDSIIARHAKEKVLFYSCKSYPKCDFSTWDKPLSESCPKCGEMLYYRKTRRSVLCKNKGCDYLREEEITDEN